MKLSWRIWLLIFVLMSSLLVIFFSLDNGIKFLPLEEGVIIKSVEQNSSALEAGLRSGMIIKSINGQTISNIDDYNKLISSIFPVQNKTKLTITSNSEIILFTEKAPEISVANIPKTKLKTGLDLSGGARALVKPEIPVSAEEIMDLVTVTSNRLNVYGISDVSVRAVSDLSGNNFMLVEVAGATPADLNDLVSKQGKFEAKIGNETLFVGGNEDITYVARTGEQSGIYGDCPQTANGYQCQFRFTITLSAKAAERHAEITGKLDISPENPEYLSEPLDLYLDDQLTSSLQIGKDLKGSTTTQISISGPGNGATKEEAFNNAMAEMNQLQTVLITGSLPYKLEIVKIDTISPVLGKEFAKNIALLALIAFLAVSTVLFIKYRKIKITLSVILTMFSEAFITLAIAALIKWNLDAPSIAGIIAGMGTGVNDQIVILDEAVSNTQSSLKERIKNALFIIFGAFFIIVAAMLPLFWAGAGMLKGFALTTIIGVSVGILITRPAFAEIVKLIVKE